MTEPIIVYILVAVMLTTFSILQRTQIAYSAMKEGLSTVETILLFTVLIISWPVSLTLLILKLLFERLMNIWK